ncbi:MAG: bifunctional 3-deoxy-7-phosphoheptulonate synthase/chorismate mutase type II [Muribaculaceae bacterium]|nr:bifunctional 3-deoxy-7-phosphoheptulonate synthase/chorismate mutase type II [Muribaculaceae bacterium]
MSSKLLQDIETFEDYGHPLIIAGPCSAESKEQVLTTAHELNKIGINIFRAGLWKPRTLPSSFEGVGQQGLEWLIEVKHQTGMRVATEVATPLHVEASLKAGIDILWIGARTVTNPFAMQEIADALSVNPDVIVLVKNPINPDIDLWIGALLRVYNAGIRKLGAIHRGFSTYGNHIFRNSPQWNIPIELHRRIPHLPILCDPSHMGGKREYIPTLSQSALDMGFNGLFIESHCNPDKALSDKEQQITPNQLNTIINSLVIREKGFATTELNLLRELIDQCDNELLEVLARRMHISRQIGTLKKDHKLQVVHTDRYNSILNKMIEQGDKLQMNPEFIKKVMSAIHEESVRQQIQILNKNDKNN